MQNFTPLAGLAGGLMIGLASALYLIASGRIAGISGMLEALLKPTVPGFGLAATFLVGIPIGALATFIAMPSAFSPVIVKLSGSPLVQSATLVFAGLAVGFGTRLANGCTSGHGVCGLPRFSARSLAATAIFMATAMLTVFVTRHLV